MGIKLRKTLEQQLGLVGKDNLIPYAGIGSGGAKPHSVCQWPECERFGHRWIRMGESMPYVAMCPTHLRKFRRMSFYEVERMEFQPRRRRLVDPSGKHEGGEV